MAEEQEAGDSPEWRTGDGCGIKPPQCSVPGPPPVDTRKREGSELQAHPYLQSESEVSLGYLRPCLKRKTEKEKGREGEKGIWEGSPSTGRCTHILCP